MDGKNGENSRNRQIDEYKKGEQLNFTFLDSQECGVIIGFVGDKIKVQLECGTIAIVGLTKTESKFFYINK